VGAYLSWGGPATKSEPQAIICGFAEFGPFLRSSETGKSGYRHPFWRGEAASQPGQTSPGPSERPL